MTKVKDYPVAIIQAFACGDARRAVAQTVQRVSVTNTWAVKQTVTVVERKAVRQKVG